MKAECCIVASDRLIKISSDGKHIVLKNSSKRNFLIVNIDGCLVTTGIRCDKAVRDDNKVDVLIEFKGGDIGHGSKQIVATAEFWIASAFNQRPIHGCLVTTNTPSFDASVQRAKIEMKKRFGGNFCLRKPGRAYSFSELIKP